MMKPISSRNVANFVHGRDKREGDTQDLFKVRRGREIDLVTVLFSEHRVVSAHYFPTAHRGKFGLADVPRKRVMWFES